MLDGQQRLTAFNIGLRGSYATSARTPGKRLYLDLGAEVEDPGAEADQYRFEFRPDGEGGDANWFPVADAVGLEIDAASLTDALAAVGLAPRQLSTGGPSSDSHKRSIRNAFYASRSNRTQT